MSFFGYNDILKELLKDKRVDPSVDNNEALNYAVENEHLKTVKILLSDYRFTGNINEAIEIADSKDTDTSREILDLLLEYKNKNE